MARAKPPVACRSANRSRRDGWRSGAGGATGIGAGAVACVDRGGGAGDGARAAGLTGASRSLVGVAGREEVGVWPVIRAEMRERMPGFLVEPGFSETVRAVVA